MPSSLSWLFFGIVTAIAIWLTSLCNIAAAEESSISQYVITPAEIIEIVVVPNAVTRYHLIRNLYCEIVENVRWYCQVGGLFSHWTKTNIGRRPNKEPAEIERITWNVPIFINTYDSAQSEIRSTLWGREITGVHRLYAKFKTLDSMIGALAREIEKAKEVRLRNSEIKLKCAALDRAELVKLEQLMASDEARQGIIIKGYADQISKDLSDLASFSDPRACARDNFYGRWFYVFHGVAIIAVVLILGVIIRVLATTIGMMAW